jgi:hypothetical protein
MLKFCFEKTRDNLLKLDRLSKNKQHTQMMKRIFYHIFNKNLIFRVYAIFL